MTFTVSQLVRFFQCGHRYYLQDVQGVPVAPSIRQVVSRVVRDAIHEELSCKLYQDSLLAPSESRQRIEELSRLHTSQDIQLTQDEARQGQRRVFESIWASASKLVMMWRAVVARQIDPTHLRRPFSLEISGHTVTGEIEIQEGSRSVRSTKVRSRSPEEGEAAADIPLMLYAMAVDKLDGRATDGQQTDFLIESGGKLNYVKQSATLELKQIVAIEERVSVMGRSIDAGVFLPSYPGDWRCRQCPLRQVCRYV